MSPHTDIPHDFDPSPVRLHGSLRVYYSAYGPEYLENLARLLDASASRDISTWCIFDNTTLGAATVDALIVKSHLLNRERVAR